MAKDEDEAARHEQGHGQQEYACRCLNLRWEMRVEDESGNEGELVDGTWQVSQPSLVSVESPSPSSRNVKGKARETARSNEGSSSSKSTRKSSPPSLSSSSNGSTLLRCLNCDSLVLSYTATSDSQIQDLQQAPKSNNGLFTIDRDQLVTSRNEIQAIMQDPAYSQLFSVLVVDVPPEQQMTPANGNTPFHDTANARIKEGKEAVDAAIAKLRAEQARVAKTYMAQADALAMKITIARNQEDIRKAKITSPLTTSKPLPNTAQSPPPIVQRGGFDTPATGSSPSPSRPASVSTSVKSTLSPYTSVSSLYPSFGTSAQKQKGIQQIAQPAGPQSPSFRRSRSPSPSKDSSLAGRAGSQSRERGSSRDRVTGGTMAPSMDRRNSGSGQGTASTTKRPALDLDRDVSKQEGDASSKAQGSADNSSRGRTTNTKESVPHHPSLKNPLPPSSASASTARSKPSSGGAWLRLNDISPPPPASRSLIQSIEDGVNRFEAERAEQKKVKQKAEEDPATLLEAAAIAKSKEDRPSLKERHVSFKEPEKAQRDVGADADTSILQPEHETIEAEETIFDLDEDVESSSDEDDSEETVASSIASGLEPAEDQKRNSPLIPPGLASYREQHKDLIQMLDKAGSFVDTLKRVHAPKPPVNELAEAYDEAYSGLGGRRYYGSTRLTGSGLGKPPPRATGSTLTPVVAARLKERAQEFRDSLAMDLPSHRTRKSKKKKGRAVPEEKVQEEEDEEITDEQMNQLAPVYSMASSLPIAIGFQLRPNQQQEYEFERKTSVPNRESMMVPRLHKRDRLPDGGYANTVGGLAILGEEVETPMASAAGTPTESSTLDGRAQRTDIPGAKEARREEIEAASTMDVSQNSPAEPKLDSVSAGADARIASLNRDEEDEQEARDVIKEMKQEKGFVPPHVWARKNVDELDVLGTSVHDYE